MGRTPKRGRRPPIAERLRNLTTSAQRMMEQELTGRKQFPSMTALQVLLAVAERGSTRAAADPLSLSQSAVSKQLNSLEDVIGGPAFLRTPKGMITTELGAIYIEHARTAIKAMEDAELRASRLKPGPRVLRLQVPPILGDRWLLPQFAQFTETYPDIEVQFTSVVSSIQAEVPDGSFRYMAKKNSSDDATYLFGDDVRLVCSPTYWEKLAFPDTLESAAKGVVLEHPQTPLHWQHLVEAYGLPSLTPRHTMRFGYFTMVIRAALAGQGMALIPRGLISEDLSSRRLINIGDLGFKSGFGYWFTRNRDLSPNPSIRRFERWLKAVAKTVFD